MTKRRETVFARSFFEPAASRTRSSAVKAAGPV